MSSQARKSDGAGQLATGGCYVIARVGRVNFGKLRNDRQKPMDVVTPELAEVSALKLPRRVQKNRAMFQVRRAGQVNPSIPESSAFED
jgi:hypothetical protein